MTGSGWLLLIKHLYPSLSRHGRGREREREIPSCQRDTHRVEDGMLHVPPRVRKIPPPPLPRSLFLIPYWSIYNRFLRRSFNFGTTSNVQRTGFNVLVQVTQMRTECLGIFLWVRKSVKNNSSIYKNITK